MEMHAGKQNLPGYIHKLAIAKILNDIVRDYASVWPWYKKYEFHKKRSLD